VPAVIKLRQGRRFEGRRGHPRDYLHRPPRDLDGASGALRGSAPSTVLRLLRFLRSRGQFFRRSSDLTPSYSIWRTIMS